MKEDAELLDPAIWTVRCTHPYTFQALGTLDPLSLGFHSSLWLIYWRASIGAHLLQAYISYRRVQLMNVRVLMFGRHTTMLGGMRWCIMVPPKVPVKTFIGMYLMGVFLMACISYACTSEACTSEASWARS